VIKVGMSNKDMLYPELSLQTEGACNAPCVKNNLIIEEKSGRIMSRQFTAGTTDNSDFHNPAIILFSPDNINKPYRCKKSPR